MYLFRKTHIMVSKLLLSAVFGTLGFLTCILVQNLFALHHHGSWQGLDLASFTNPLAFSSEAGNMPRLGHSSSPSQQHLCDHGDRLFALLSG